MRKRVTEAAVLGALATVAGCTSLLGIGGEFKVEGSGGATSSSTGAGNGGATTGGGGGGTPSTGGGGSGGALPSGPITGHRVTIQLGPKSHTPLSKTPTPFVTDAADHVLEVIVQHENGDWQTFTLPGGKDDGTFEFDGVPPGPYVLHVDNTWAWMNNRDDIDLDLYTPARPDYDSLQNDPTASFDLSWTVPWTDADTLSLFSPTTYTFGGLDLNAEVPLNFMPGSTSLNGTLDWNSVVGPGNALLTAADPIWFTHITTASALPYNVIVDAANPITVSMQDVDGAVFDVDANLTHVPQDQSLKVNIDVAAFEAITSSFRTDAVNPACNFFYDVAPVPLDVAGDMGAGADLVSYPGVPGPTLQTTLHFGNPFPTDATHGWEPEVILTTGADIPFQLPGCSTMPPTNTTIGVTQMFLLPNDPLLNPATQLKPPLGAATNATIDGHSLDATNLPMLGSLTPTLTWGPPSHGTVDYWEIKIREVLPVYDGSTPPVCTGAKLATKATVIYIGGEARSMTVPLGVLKGPTYYEFGIIGYHAPNSDFQKRPTRAAPPYYLVNCISEAFGTPAGP